MVKSILAILIVGCLQVTLLFAQAEPPKPESAAEGVFTPVSYGIVVDNSGSYRMILEKVIKLVKDVAGENRAGDETFLVRFISTEKISLVQEFTTDKDDINDAADNLYVEGGLTSIVDALYFSAKHLARKANTAPGRARFLVLVTDGEERQSTTKYEDLLKFLKDENIRVFVIGLAEEKVFTRLLDKIAKDSGGALYTPKTAADISAAIKSLSTEVRKK